MTSGARRVPRRARAPARRGGPLSDPDIKHYSNGEVTVVWKPGVCMHSAVCFRGLPQVFDPSRRPWVTIGGATTQAIVAQVRRCPSGALSILPVHQKKPVDPGTE